MSAAEFTRDLSDSFGHLVWHVEVALPASHCLCGRQPDKHHLVRQGTHANEWSFDQTWPAACLTESKLHMQYSALLQMAALHAYAAVSPCWRLWCRWPHAVFARLMLDQCGFVFVQVRHRAHHHRLPVRPLSCKVSLPKHCMPARRCLTMLRDLCMSAIQFAPGFFDSFGHLVWYVKLARLPASHIACVIDGLHALSRTTSCTDSAHIAMNGSINIEQSWPVGHLEYSSLHMHYSDLLQSVALHACMSGEFHER